MLRTGLHVRCPCRSFCLVLAVCIQSAAGGICWEYIDDTTKLCKRTFVLGMSYEECCGIPGLPSVSWTPHDISKSGNIFFWKFLSIGANTCQRCHKNCSSVLCEDGKSCRMVDGFPVCVCKPQCDRSLKTRGVLCGTDGQKYRNYCTLQKYNCVKEQQISVEYFGRCRNSCRRVQCEAGKHCLQDQNGVPHCILCQTDCTAVPSNIPADYMCAENGKTYRNTCELKADICKTGRSIRISHHGHCFAHETCRTLACPMGTKCLISTVSHKPVCMNCNARCIQSLKVPICGTDQKTYSSYCDMVMSSCRSGVFVSTKRRGPCRRLNKRENTSNAKLKRRTNFKRNKKHVGIMEPRKRKLRHNRRKRRQYKKNRRHRHKNVNHIAVSDKTNTLSDKRTNRHLRRQKVLEESIAHESKV